ncbi:MAG: aldo/keto reductase [Rhodococcus sp. (in: high G+C Gram-positive bacteria)]
MSLSSRTVGRLGKIGLGTAQLGNLYEPMTDANADSIVAAAWDEGVRYFDTAPHYGLGLSERRLGRALAPYPRDEYVLSTKVGRLLVANPAGPAPDGQGFAVTSGLRREWDFTAAGVQRSLEDSLDRLGMDRVDIAYVHDPDDFLDQAVDEALPALASLRDAGMLEAVGAGMNDAGALSRIIDEADVDVVMCAGRLTLLDQSARDLLLPAARRRGVAVVAAAPFNSGLLAEPSAAGDLRFDYRPAPLGLRERANEIANVCARFGVALPAAALAFPFLDPTVRCVVVGMQSIVQVRRNLEAAFADIPGDVWHELAARGLVPLDTPAV